MVEDSLVVNQKVRPLRLFIVSSSYDNRKLFLVFCKLDVCRKSIVPKLWRYRKIIERLS